MEPAQLRVLAILGIAVVIEAVNNPTIGQDLAHPLQAAPGAAGAMLALLIAMLALTALAAAAPQLATWIAAIILLGAVVMHSNVVTSVLNGATNLSKNL